MEDDKTEWNFAGWGSGEAARNLPARQDSKAHFTRTALAVSWVLWAGVFLWVYTRQAWRHFSLRPIAWVEEHISLRIDPALWQILTSGTANWGFPAIREALLRAAWAFWGAAAILASALILGGWVCKALGCRTDDRREDLFFRCTTGLGVLAYLLLGSAGLGVYTRPTIQLLIPGILFAGGFQLFIKTVARYRAKPSTWEAITREVDPLRAWMSLKSRLAGSFPWTVIVSGAILFALVGALAPEIEYDALWYHLWLPKVWLQQGGPVDILEEYVSLYPLTWELLYGAGLALGGQVAAKLLHFSCLPLIALLIVISTRRYFLSVSPWKIVAIWVTIPTVLWEATTAYIDLALCLYALAALYAMARYLERKQQSWLVLAGIHLGFALAIKHLAMIFLLLIPSGLALLEWRATREMRRALAPAIWVGLLGLLVALPWYWRSWSASGNPVFPELFGIFGANPPARWDAITQQGLDYFKSTFGNQRTLTNLSLLPWDMVVHAARYGGSLGPLILLFLPGLAIAHHKGTRLRGMAAFALAYLVFWASPLSSFQLRFLIPITPILALLAGEGYGRLEEELTRGLGGKSIQRALQTGLVLLLLFNLPPFTSLHEGDRVGWKGWLTHVMHGAPVCVVLGCESQEAYLKRNVHSYSAWGYINAHLPEDSRVLTFSGGDHFYSERARLWSDATVARPAVWGVCRGDEQQALQALKQLGITDILFDMSSLESIPADTLAIAQPEVIDECFHLEYQDSRYSLYHIQEEK